MMALGLGLLVFIALHLLPATGLRERLVEGLGPKTYRLLFSLLSALALAMVVWGKGQAGYHPLWNPPVWTRHLTPLLMLASIYLLVTYLMAGKLKGLTAHPMLWGVLLWALAHLLANGDWASVLLFGTFTLYSLWAILRGRHPVRPGSGSARREMLVALVALGLYAGLLVAHPVLFGVAVIGR